MDLSWLVILSIGFDYTLFTLAHSNDQWYRFATSPSYKNNILLLDSYTPFKTYHIPKANLLLLARMECARTCSLDDLCEAFNFYETDESYVCQPLPDNLCKRKGRLVLQGWPGGLVWDKLGPVMSKSCIDQKLEEQTGTQLCETLRPGCQGTWPACTDCFKSCYDYKRNGFSDCTLWPEGGSSRPIFGHCYDSATYIIKRGVDINSGYETQRYVMPFLDVERVSRVKHYTTIEFWFATTQQGVVTSYKFSSIDSNGKMTNFYLNSGNDGFNLQGQTRSLEYVNVSQVDDIFSCGSFWLLDKNNATRCPGGQVSVFGTPKMVESTVITGIRWPMISDTIVFTDVKLAP